MGFAQTRQEIHQDLKKYMFFGILGVSMQDTLPIVQNRLKRLWMLILPRKWIAVLVIIGVFLGSWAFASFFSSKNENIYETVKAERGQVIQTVSSTGTVKSTDEISLSFEVSGKLAELSVAVGESVVKGQVLARLVSTDLQTQVEQAAAQLASAQSGLNKLFAGSSREEIAISEQNLESARIAYKASQNAYQNTIDQTNRDVTIAELAVKTAEDELTSAEDNLQNTLLSQGQSIANYRDSAYRVSEDQYFLAQKALDTINQILTDGDKQTTFGIQNSSMIPVAQQSFQKAQAQGAFAWSALQTAKFQTDEKSLLNAMDQTLVFIQNTAGALNDIFTVLLYTPSSSGYTATELASDKSSIQSQQSTMATASSTTLTAKSNYTNAKAADIGVVDTAKSKVEAAENSLEKAKNNLTSSQITAKTKQDSARSDMESKASAVKTAQAQLNLTRANPREADVSAQRAIIAQYAALLSERKNALAKAELLASADGVITDISFDEGEYVSALSPFLILHGSDVVYIETSISEADIALVNRDDAVEFTFDAFGPGEIFHGKVDFVDPAETVISDVVYYQVKIVFDASDERIKTGMTANVDIAADQKQSVVLVPQRAVSYREGVSFIKVLVNENFAEDRIVKTGLRGDSGMVEVVSGVSEGENVVVSVKKTNP